MRRRRVVSRRVVGPVAALAVTLLSAGLAGSLAAPEPVAAAPAADGDGGSAGAPGAGDPYFPRQGNGGYDVAHYRLRIGYQPDTHGLTGVAVVSARTTAPLSRFDLDLRRNLKVSSVTVDGAPAAFAQPKNRVQELVITPATPLGSGQEFRVQVRYAGTAQPTHDPDGSLDGFIPTDDGAFVASEPQGSPTWFPVNDTPRDKATYAITVTVPKGLAAISNGALVSHRDRADTSVWSWRLDQPVSSYLVTATIGDFDVSTGTTPSGLPYVVAVDPRESAAADPVLATLPDILDYFSQVYGPYPFAETGAIVDHAPFVGFALETATRPLFEQAPDEATLSHELAHQWYGDAVTLSHWRDIWLNEGFAEFSSWLWTEHTGGPTTAQRLADYLALPPDQTYEWLPPPGNPGAADEIFASSVYDRGAATLAALRQLVGDPTFFAIMRGWYADHLGGNATVADFTAYAQSVAGQDLTAFFRNWLYAPHQPHP